MTRRWLCIVLGVFALLLVLPTAAFALVPLPLPTTITGVVYKADGVTPAAGVDIGCFLASNGNSVTSDTTGADGTFTLSGLAVLTGYKVNMVLTDYNAANGTSFQNEFYDNDLTYTWDAAKVVTPGHSIVFVLGPSGHQMVPVYRFYNTSTGVHFYTASEAEKNDVIAKYPAFKLEGVSYQVNTANVANTFPLFRFYNKQKGVHFYTASAAEKQDVINKYSSIYNYEGIAYYVSGASVPGALNIYRFYNKKVGGVHFYTASETEKNDVIAKYPTVYAYEGVGYWIGQ